MSSGGGRVTFPLGTLYHGTKFAVEGLSESLHFELAPLGVRVKIVEPGAIKTDFMSRSLDFSNDPQISEYQPLVQKVFAVIGPMMEQRAPPEQIAEGVYAATTDDSKQLAGNVLRRAGLAEDLLQQPSVRLASEDYYRLWDGIEAELGDAHLPLRLCEAIRSESFSPPLLAALLEGLPSGLVMMETIARRLGLSKRTLQRRIDDEGTSFQQILKETREALARHYLEETSLPVAEISFLLGFSEPNSFYRGFRAWTGTTPDQAYFGPQTAPRPPPPRSGAASGGWHEAALHRASGSL
ncbi:SDR family NAD(P)-dependent oxidoreductase [Sorangium sp. KYC3313]|uniref:SDR family NAD(P)-dependent oxidoreductase n=1 Tax=Sorangium sp. KYC3313 TaxID=3449740 RepID=UPI003F8A9017